MPAHSLCLFGNERLLNQLGVLKVDDWLDMDAATYFNQRPDYGDCDRGEWLVQCDRLAFDMRPGHRGTVYLVLFTGTFGNDHSPVASSFTYCDLYDVSDPEDVAAYLTAVADAEAAPEYLTTTEEE
jgi:hypothetical protein